MFSQAVTLHETGLSLLQYSRQVSPQQVETQAGSWAHSKEVEIDGSLQKASHSDTVQTGFIVVQSQ